METLEELAGNFLTEKIVLADLHTHFSAGSSAQFKEGDFNKAVDCISKRLMEYSVVGLINVNDDRYEQFIGLKGYDRVDIGNAIYIPEKKLVIVKGQKVFTSQGSFIALGINKGVHINSRNISLEDALKESWASNSVNLMCLPSFKEGCGSYVEANPRLLEYFDAIEITNKDEHATMQLKEFFQSLKSKMALGKIDYCHIGGISVSNGHSFEEVGKNYIILSYIDIEDSAKLNASLRREVRNTKQFSSQQI